jgi:drug/metabolite transporter (DMT)-like permease
VFSQIQLYFTEFIRWQERLSWSQSLALICVIFAGIVFILVLLGDNNAQDIERSFGRDSFNRDYKKRD